MNKQCVWLSDDFTMVCVSDKSEHCADFVDEDICEVCRYREFIVGIDTTRSEADV